jgi:hypothetical protein
VNGSNGNPATTDICPDCGVIPGMPHTAKCGARDSGQDIWPGYTASTLSWLTAEVSSLRGQLDRALDRIGALEAASPEARQLQYEADLAAADLTESGYDDGVPASPIGALRHGSECQCPYCYDEPDDGDDMPEFHATRADGKEPS